VTTTPTRTMTAGEALDLILGPGALRLVQRGAMQLLDAVRAAGGGGVGVPVLQPLRIAEGDDAEIYGLRVKTVARDPAHPDGRQVHIDLLCMIYNWRLVASPVEFPEEFERGWCYLGPRSFTNALLAAIAWDGADTTMPDGWYKDVRTGERRRENYIGDHPPTHPEETL
jgi:hypothetical protein